MDAAEREAFDAFARGRMRELLRFAHVLTGDPHRAADLVQDALERTLLSCTAGRAEPGCLRSPYDNLRASEVARTRVAASASRKPKQPKKCQGGPGVGSMHPAAAQDA